ncbi:cytochrome P450 [Dictyobacter kobayashii]|uniref:Putative cytochrome P450 YjiB n=1 Tax=Dictyobacter kobayashii TaxID=2014872 RepID=A0A402ASS9_9CHLR|nr:cytochrome P450 [Dictyobacter kobayashii]GCE22142.1 putative cytochrome P450 YjiB [Dictyobacter kobayashii]
MEQNPTLSPQKMDTQAQSLFPGFAPMPGQPAFYNTARQTWLVFRYDSVQRVLQEYTTFSNERGGLDPLQKKSSSAFERPNMLSMDPPRHRQYRNLAASAFTPRTIAKLEPRIIRIVHALLDRVIDRGEMDVIDDLSYPLSITVIAELLGVPASDQEQFRRWTEDFFQITTPEAQQAQQELGSYFQHVLEQHRREPQDDLITALLNAEIDEHKLTDGELISLCSLILLAGNDTTRNLIGNLLLCLDAFPLAMEQIRANPDLIPSAIEETLRFLPSVHTAPRLCIADTELDDQQIKAGQWVMPMLASANRDASYFPDPDVFEINRSPNRHLTFGYGIHFCLGAPLARLESKIAMEILLTRMHDIKRVGNILLQPLVSPVIYGVRHLPITFTRTSASA